MLARQKITVGKQRARAVVQVAILDGVIQVFHAGTLISDTTLIRRRYNENQRPAAVIHARSLAAGQ